MQTFTPSIALAFAAACALPAVAQAERQAAPAAGITPSHAVVSAAKAVLAISDEDQPAEALD